ncbi:MAG: hypothetical protein ACM31C_04325 [Acidobacteriota bacterium]
MPDSDPKQPPDAGGSGSVEVQLSGPNLPAVAAPEAVPPDDSQPVSSGRVQAVEANEGTGPAKRSKRISTAIQNTVSGGIEALGGTIERLGGGVEKLGDVTKKVPLVGPSVAALGEGLTKAGESIQGFPEAAKTRRGKLLVQSVVVGLLVVAVWIAAIVLWQLRTTDVPDFRGDAEQILVQLSKGQTAIEQLYDNASPRFTELVQKERFVDDMTDMNATFGKFREITAINGTLVTTGPTGRIGRVSLTAAFERGVVKGNISFHWDQGKWKLFGISLEVPAELKISQAEREQRVAACLDDKGHDISKDLSPEGRKKCPVRDAAETILEQLDAGKAGDVWDHARDVFQTQEPRDKFIEIQDEHRSSLGKYRRIVDVTEAHQFTSTARVRGSLVELQSATFDVLAEFDRSSGVRVVFGFEREKKTDPWQLRSFKLVVPMPRAQDDTAPATPATPEPALPKLTKPPPHEMGAPAKPRKPR